LRGASLIVPAFAPLESCYLGVGQQTHLANGLEGYSCLIS